MEEEIPAEGGDLFGHSKVQELESEDFALASIDGLVLNREGCSIVLFYDMTSMSMNLREMFVDLAEQFSGINFCGVNTTRRSAIMKRVSQIQSNPNHPFWRYLRHIYRESLVPFILVFREVETGVGYPQAVYNGALDQEAIADWLSNRACQPGYNEFPGPDDLNVVIDDDTGEGIDYLVNPPPFASRKSKSIVDRELARRGKIVEEIALEENPYDSPSVMPNTPLKPYKSKTKSDLGFYKF
jgi:hypothetical protein